MHMYVCVMKDQNWEWVIQCPQGEGKFYTKSWQADLFDNCLFVQFLHFIMIGLENLALIATLHGFSLRKSQRSWWNYFGKTE